MSTRTQRQSSLLSLSEVKQIVDGIPLGRVDPKQVAQVAKRVFEGEGVQGPAALSGTLHFWRALYLVPFRG